jgi:DNA-binding NarL/FixJ family response regulator
MTDTVSQIPLGINIRTSTPFTILLAVDSPNERLFLKNFFQSEKFQVSLEVDNGLAVLDSFPNLKPLPDILCIDYNIPKKDALDVIWDLKNRGLDFKSVITASFADKERLTHFKQAGINSYLLKPLNKVVVKEKIAKLLGRQDLLPRNIKADVAPPLKLEALSIPMLSLRMGQVPILKK